MLSVIILSVIMLSVIMLRVIMLSVIMLSVIMLSIIMLKGSEFFHKSENQKWIQKLLLYRKINTT